MFFERVSKEQFTEGDYTKIKMPTRATKYSAGYDFYAPRDISLSPNGSTIVQTGIRWNAENAQCFLMIVPRSGLGFKYQIGLANTVGIIDADYYDADNEGHIMVKLVNRGNDRVKIKQGERFCQGIVIPYLTTWNEQVLSDNRTGGFGSSGK